jgi:hypothetical protein
MSKQNTTSKEYREQTRTTKQIKQKLLQHKATIGEADKGKPVVIIYKQDLNEKVNSFIKGDNITELKTDPTKKMQRIVKNTLKQCKNIVDSSKRKYVLQMNPQAPKLKAKIKIHKPEAPIRPVINNIYAPKHKIAKHIHQKLNDSLKLKHEYNVINTTQLAENLE